LLFGLGRRSSRNAAPNATANREGQEPSTDPEFLDISREKWREVPGGDTLDRIFSSDLLSFTDDALRQHWQQLYDAGSHPTHRGWYQTLYREFMSGRHVVEVGSGLGFDGIHFMQLGARWTFTDIVKDNLAIVRRMVEMHGLADRADYLWIDRPEALETLPGGVDVLWANGSLHHAPFEIARREAQILLAKLKPGGRWIELFYPYERWLRQGRLPFSEWGKFTDGPRTPWAEWHDADRIKQRLFPAATTTLLDYRFGGGQYGWLDLRVDRPVLGGSTPTDIDLRLKGCDAIGGELKSLNGKLSRRANGVAFTLTGKMWSYGASIGLKDNALLRQVPAAEGFVWALDLEVTIDKGAAGFVLTRENRDDFVGREIMLDARSGTQRLTITTDGPEAPRLLLIRNGAYESSSSGTINSACLRSAV
jgi:hypothetical protein